MGRLGYLKEFTVNRILRLERVIDRYGKSRSPIYADISAGLFPRPIKLGVRAAGWPEHEVAALVAARIAGLSEDAIRKLVHRLHSQRKESAQ